MGLIEAVEGAGAVFALWWLGVLAKRGADRWSAGYVARHPKMRDERNPLDRRRQDARDWVRRRAEDRRVAPRRNLQVPRRGTGATKLRLAARLGNAAFRTRAKEDRRVALDRRSGRRRGRDRRRVFDRPWRRSRSVPMPPRLEPLASIDSGRDIT